MFTYVITDGDRGPFKATLSDSLDWATFEFDAKAWINELKAHNVDDLACRLLFLLAQRDKDCN